MIFGWPMEINLEIGTTPSPLAKDIISRGVMMPKRCWIADGGGDCGEIQCGTPSLPSGRGWAGNSMIDHLSHSRSSSSIWYPFSGAGTHTFIQYLIPFFRCSYSPVGLLVWSIFTAASGVVVVCLFVWMVVCLDIMCCWPFSQFLSLALNSFLLCREEHHGALALLTG